MKNTIILFVLSVLVITACVSCTDFLDKDLQTDTNLDYEQIFRDPHLAPGFLNNAYTLLPDGFNRVGSALLASACDEAEHSDAGSEIRLFNSNSISESYNPDNVWANMYTGIRKCNIFLKELDGLIAEHNSIPLSERPNFRGQALFLRTFYHFELLKRFQNIIYVDKVIDPFNKDEIYSLKQSNFHDAVDLIVADCDSATVLLPNKITDDAQKGRPTKAASMALKARILLYAASPLNNPNNDISLWARAEQAAKEIYDNRSQLGIGLESNYAGVFTTPYNNEIIFATRASNRNDIETSNFPISYQGKGYTNPSQNLVDAYVMAGTSYASSMSGYNPNNPYDKREARFYATIIHNGATFKDTQVETFVEGKDGLYATPTATKTGYYLRKFLVPAINLEKNETARRPWILFRYAEVILNYAEARNEAVGPDKTVHDLLNLIRSRAGLRPFRNANEYITTQEGMRTYIKKERQVELAFEEHRFWDLRRWKDAEVILNTPIKGMQIEKANDVLTYEIFNAGQRVFDTKFYWYPIPRVEILKYKSEGVNLTQNPGWD